MKGYLRMALAVTVVLGALATMYLLKPEREVLTVDKLMADPESFLGREISVKGRLSHRDPTNGTFVLAGRVHSVNVTFAGKVALALNETVIVRGVLEKGPGGYFLEARGVESTCPTRYGGMYTT